MSTNTRYFISMPFSNIVVVAMFQLRRALFVVFTAFVSLAAQNASAYNFEVTSSYVYFDYVHITTVSSFCHDRTALDVNRGDQPQWDVFGSTASICLINGVQASVRGTLYTWSGVGSPGGKWILINESTRGSVVTPAHLCVMRPGMTMGSSPFSGDC